jgi:pimeloyl-ACP methyl ester carboxylesterase
MPVNRMRQAPMGVARKVGRIMLTAVIVLFGVLVVMAGILLVLSPGKPRPIVDASGQPVPGSISEKVFVEINGVQQGMVIQSRDPANPVLLYLHGGMPEYFLTERYPTGLEEHFTVCWWEQRGSGLSYHADQPVQALTVDQAIADTLAVTDYLRSRFHADKIYLLAHSGGTFIGVQAARRAPERYYAYIGVAQMSHQLKSEKLAYDYMLERFREQGNNDMVRKLEDAPVSMEGGTPRAYLELRDPGMHPLGIGTMHDMNSVMTGIILPSLASTQYTLGEKLNLWRAKASTGVSPYWGEMLRTDLSQTLPKMGLPVYFFGGIFDYTVSYTEAKAYFQQLEAPVKGFYTFEHSAHSPIFEEPQKAQRIMLQDVLHGTNNLADGK